MCQGTSTLAPPSILCIKNKSPIVTFSFPLCLPATDKIAKPITPLYESASEEDSDPEQADPFVPGGIASHHIAAGRARMELTGQGNLGPMELIGSDVTKLETSVEVVEGPGPMTHLVASPTLANANSGVMQGASCTQRKISMKNLTLIAKYFKKIYKPTNNNLKTSSNSRSKNVDTSLRYKNDNQIGQFGNQRIMTIVGAMETVGRQVVQQTRIQCFNCKEFSHFAKECSKPEKRQHSEQPESIINTCVVEKVDSNVIPDSPDMCDNDIQTDQNAKERDDERVALANLIANLKLDVNENKRIQKQLKKANTSLAHELKECKSILAETSRTLGGSNSIRDSCLIALQNKQTELETYKTLNDRTVDYDKLEHKLNETLGLLAQKEIDIKEGLKLKVYEISAVKEKHDELVKQDFLTKSHYEGLVKEKTKVITDLKLKEVKDIDKMISMEKH
ncbi:retrovirus-related pol polyprotein from transposon TNT 1-94 [Tanacetum coccineum]|uniref:Retrovirus-related pol polyprotein from transposon TNT 1-94 n=1 Tax=Tanacetum coccineum TaxID=301880 RepID=A0ABQ5ITX2_9ASTR